MTIRFLNSQDVVAFRELRLHALREAPTAFGSDFEREVQFTLEEFAARMSVAGEPSSGVFGAFDGERLVGITGFSREIRVKRAHIASLWSVYVLPEFRGQGIAARLLDAAIDYARQLDCVRQIMLSVTADNEPARRLYRSRGFEVYGLEPDALCVDGAYYDEEHMVLRLHYTA